MIKFQNTSTGQLVAIMRATCRFYRWSKQDRFLNTMSEIVSEFVSRGVEFKY
jgi:hypothetical protein